MASPAAVAEEEEVTTPAEAEVVVITEVATEVVTVEVMEVAKVAVTQVDKEADTLEEVSEIPFIGTLATIHIVMRILRCTYFPGF